MVPAVQSFQGVQVIGASIKSVVDGLGAFRSISDQLLSENGIADPQADRWYPFEQWMRTFASLSRRLGPATLFQIGQKIPENAVFPPHISSLEKALASIDLAYQMNQRGAKPGQIGNYVYAKTGERSATIVSNTPFPCDFDRGIIVAMANKFKGDARVTVDHEYGACRNKGQASCTYWINW